MWKPAIGGGKKGEFRDWTTLDPITIKKVWFFYSSVALCMIFFIRSSFFVIFEKIVNKRPSKAFNWETSYRAGARFSKAPKTFWARKTIFSSSVSRKGEVFITETSSIFNCMYEGNLIHVNITTLWSQGSRFCYCFTDPKGFRGFRETGPRSPIFCLGSK